MSVNLNKTKVVVFRKGGPLRYYERWYLNGKEIECVNSYKYLGITFSSNNTWGKATSTLAQQGLKTLAGIRTISYNVGNMPFIPYFKLINTCLSPVLLYGSEVWGSKPYDVIEAINVKACKQFMMVSSKTTNAAVLGDCGRYPLFISIVMRLISYWLRILQMSSDRYPYKCFQMLHYLDTTGHSNWASGVKNVLFKFGFGIVWISQDVGSVNNFLQQLSERLHDISSQEWFTKACSLSKLRTYVEFKSLLCPEQYLLEVTIPCHRRALSRLRCSNHSLIIESGRYHNIDVDDRICQLCDTDEIEDEYHFVLVCPLFIDIRNHLPQQYTVNSSRDKFYSLMSSNKSSTIKSLAFYVYNAFLRRDLILNDNI
jgi:hypothetical protein